MGREGPSERGGRGGTALDEAVAGRVDPGRIGRERDILLAVGDVVLAEVGAIAVALGEGREGGRRSVEIEENEDWRPSRRR